MSATLHQIAKIVELTTVEFHCVCMFVCIEIICFYYDSDALTIQDRVAYISRAIMCAKNSSAINNSNIEGEFLHELEEKLEVGTNQLSCLLIIVQSHSSSCISIFFYISRDCEIGSPS